jgi:hypothetical protein
MWNVGNAGGPLGVAAAPDADADASGAVTVLVAVAPASVVVGCEGSLHAASASDGSTAPPIAIAER